MVLVLKEFIVTGGYRKAESGDKTEVLLRGIYKI